MDSSNCASASISSPTSLSPSKKENRAPTQAKITELNESRKELFSRLQSLKRDLQNWRSNLDNQVKSHRHELTELRKSLNIEVEQLRSEFQELKTTLQQQQEDVTASLRNLGLQELPMDVGVMPVHEVHTKDNDIEVEHSEHPHDTNVDESSIEGHATEIHISSTENVEN